MKKINILFAISAAAVFFASCQNETLVRDLSPEVTFRVGLDKSGSMEATKSGELQTSDGEVVIPMSISVSDGIITTDNAQEPVTKGKQYNTTTSDQPLANFHDEVRFFHAVGWNSDGTRFIPAAASASAYDKVSYNNAKWKASDRYVWEDSDEKTFFAYANLPASGAEVTYSGTTSQTLDYAAVPATASAQTDIMLGYYKGTGETTSEEGEETGGVASISFYHPMTAVRFLQGEFQGITGIRSITLSGVHKSGKTVQTGTTLRSFEWTDLGDPDLVVSQTLTSTSLPGLGKMIGEAFLLIPQDLATNNVSLQVIAITESGDIKLEASLKTDEWVAGKTNNYTLGYDVHSYDYTFKIDEGYSSEVTFRNTETGSGTYAIHITSTKIRDDEDTPTTQSWLIKSYKIGDSEAVTVNDQAFSNVGGLTANINSTSFNISASKRYVTNTKIHDYWVNADGRTEDLDWSPKSWEDAASAIDLSRYDWHKEGALDSYSEAESKGAFSNAMNTANCYIVRHAGTYKIPLVYGNGIKNGSVNTKAYNPGLAKDNALSPFVNHLDLGITSPFIEYNTSDGQAKSESNTYLAPASASIVWQDEKNIITLGGLSETKESITVDGETYNVSYLYFTVPQTDICQNNAVIAVKDANGKAMWSWHIWISNNPAIINEDISITNKTNQKFDLFPHYAIGWIDSPSYHGRDDVEVTLKQVTSGQTITITIHQPDVIGQSAGTYYQYGRKDPICSKDGVTGFSIKETATSIGASISYPGAHYCGTSNVWYSYTSNIYWNLWSGITNANTNPDKSKVVKTVYDPSPAGYMVPVGDTFTGFSTNDKTTAGTPAEGVVTDPDISVNGGYIFYTEMDKLGGTVFFPISGQRGGDDGKITSNGGLYITSRVYTQQYYALNFNALYIYTSHGGAMASSRSLRPIKE